MSFNRFAALALSAGILAATAAAADQPSPLHAPIAHTAVLGDNASALTYWVDRNDGRHVVTTIDTVIGGTEQHSVIRFSAVLQPGQSQTVSIPAADAAQARELQIRYIGDDVELRTVPVGAKDVTLD
jgi:uncharacterized SAM-dependent methyltransferase